MKYNLSEINELIKERRTIYPKDFSPRKVHKEIVENILRNATWAPTHGLTQPWRFKVYTGEATIALGHTLAELYKATTAPENFKERKQENWSLRPAQSSVVIAIIAELHSNPNIPVIEDKLAVACAVQNMMLTATAYGIGSFWSTGAMVYSQDICRALDLKENQECLGFLYLGYAKDEWPKSHRKPIEYLTEWIDE
jgi:nitroreductase